MSTPLIIDNQTFNYPVAGESPGWGEDATAWAVAVTNVLATVSGDGDIGLTSATLANNQAVAANVSGLLFDVAVVRGAKIEYSIYRTSSTITTPKAEKGTMEVSYDGSTWSILRSATEDTGITFTISSTGQIQYTSTDVGSTSYTGTMKFYAKALGQ